MMLMPVQAIFQLFECSCHGSASGHRSSLDQAVIPPLPTVMIGKRDVSMEAHSVQDLEALSDAFLLWDVRDTARQERVREERMRKEDGVVLVRRRPLSSVVARCCPLLSAADRCCPPLSAAVRCCSLLPCSFFACPCLSAAGVRWRLVVGGLHLWAPGLSADARDWRRVF